MYPLQKFSATSLLLLLSLSAGAQEQQSNIYNSFGSELENTESSSQIGVDKFTGTAIVDFSLFKYQNPTNGLKHSISIGYDAKGVKVDKNASEVGLNWSLNLGGTIVREIKGLPDEAPNGFSNLPAVPTSIGLYDTVLLYDHLKDNEDGQFDIFSYNAGGVSGKFVIGKDGQIVSIPKNNIIIEKEFPTAVFPDCHSFFFKITLEDGTCYYYSTFNCSDVKFFSTVNSTSTQWYVTKIVAPFKQDSILFDYTRIDNAGRKNGISFMDHRIDPVDPDYEAFNQLCRGTGYFDLTERNWHPNTISYPDGTVLTFKYDNFQRIDYYNSQALNRLEIKKDNVTRGYQFYYNYTYRALDDNIQQTLDYQDYNGAGVIGTEQEYSLQLLHFNEYYTNVYDNFDTLPGYHFKYNSQTLPPRLTTYGVDLWGYYNGVKSVDAYGYPNETRFPVGRNGTNIEHPGGFRLPDLQYALAKSLEEIVLPTGGATKLFYELNTSDDFATPNISNFQAFDEVGGLRVKQIVSYDGLNYNNERVKSYEYLKEDNRSSGVMVNTPIMYLFYKDEYTNPLSLHHPIFPCSPVSYQSYSYTGNVLVRFGTNMNTLITAHGNPVGYERVIEYDGIKSKFTKKTVYEFTTNNDFPIPTTLLNNYSPFPYIPSTEFAWGLPKKISVLSFHNDLLSKTEYDYFVDINELNNNNFRALKVGFKSYPVIDAPTGFDWDYTYPITGSALVRRKLTTDYVGQNDPITIQTDYNYDFTYNLLRQVNTKNALGENIATKLYYPYDFSITTGAVALFNTKRVIFDPIRTETWNLDRDQLLDVKVADYVVSNNAVKVLASYYFSPSSPVSSSAWGAFNPNNIFQNPGYLIKRTRNDIFDIKNNVLQATLNGQTTSIMMGYNNTIAVAKVPNAPLSDIAYTSFETDNDWGRWTTSNTGYSFVDNAYVTGERAYTIGAGQYISSPNLDPARKYIFTGWADANGMVLSANTAGGVVTINPAIIADHRGWNLYQAEITNATSFSIHMGSVANVDELRLFPAGAVMSTTTYKALTGITSECDPGNKIIYYEYDVFGRLIDKRDLDGNIIQVLEYNNNQVQN